MIPSSPPDIRVREMFLYTFYFKVITQNCKSTKLIFSAYRISWHLRDKGSATFPELIGQCIECSLVSKWWLPYCPCVHMENKRGLFYLHHAA